MLNDVIVIDGEAKNWKDAINLTFNELYKKGYVKPSFYEACIEREIKFPTGLNSHIPVAIPHTDAVHVNKQAICVLRLKDPVSFYSIEDATKKVDAQFIFNMALKRNEDQLTLLRAVINIVQDKTFLEKAKKLNLNEVKNLFYKKWITEVE